MIVEFITVARPEDACFASGTIRQYGRILRKSLRAYHLSPKTLGGGEYFTDIISFTKSPQHALAYIALRPYFEAICILDIFSQYEQSLRANEDAWLTAEPWQDYFSGIYRELASHTFDSMPCRRHEARDDAVPGSLIVWWQDTFSLIFNDFVIAEGRFSRDLALSLQRRIY